MKLRKEFARDGQTVAVTAERLDGDRWRVRVGDRVLELTALPIGDGGLRLVLNGDNGARSHVVFGAAAGKHYMVRLDGRTYTLAPAAARSGARGGGADGTIRAPMTGTVLEVLCREGESVTADQTLVVLSAMKMEHKLAAGVEGVVSKVAAAAGATVEQGADLVVVEPPAEGR